ncbi:MAG: YggS family pyridoxal phosphate-dependent enzyme [Candidatus Wallbacteria bacterium]|nr:YggS family pyridoxal phosphate-dependent enzyme [Candidatus Wallbacteria bacterium]
METPAVIAENIRKIQAVIAASANPEAILVAVSKNQTVEAIKAAYDCGIRDFGENRVQEFQSKYPVLPADIRWHFIGSLQKNKVKYICGKVFLVHSVDSLSLACEIDRRAGQSGLTVKVLLEVKTSPEEGKQGVETAAAPLLVSEILKLEHLDFQGLMTMAPFVEDREPIISSFRALKKVKQIIEDTGETAVKYLSMGMSDDFQIALNEGTSIIRIGRGIFGERRG